MAAIIYSKKQLVERVIRHLNDNWPGEDWTVTYNEVLLYIDSSIPGVLKGQMFEGAKITGVIDVPEAYLVNTEFTISSQDAVTKEWYVTLPQTPMELPTGYDITNVYFTDPSLGISGSTLPIKAKRVPFREYMPKPTGVSYRLQGQNMYLKMSNGGSLLDFTLNVQMPVSRTTDINAPMNLPDGAIEPLFQKTVAAILQRYQIPQDVVKDNLPAGNKTS